MNIRYYLIALFSLFYVFANAQEVNLNVVETTAAHSAGSHDGFVINITQAKVKDVQNAWEKMINKQSENKTKAERHVKVSSIVLEKAKRMVECGHDVVILLDSITIIW